MDRFPARLGDAPADVNPFVADVRGADGGADREDEMAGMMERIRHLESLL